MPNRVSEQSGGHGARWSFLSDYDEDNKPDEHVLFIRSVRSFQCTLLRQFQPSSFSRGAQELRRQEELGTGSEADPTPNGDGEPYLARFAQPFPVRPIWAALPRPSLPGLPDQVPGGEAWASDYSCTPQVCVVLHAALRMRAAVHSALGRLAKHPVGMLVSVNPEVPEATDGGKRLLFAVVGLRAPRREEAAGTERPRRTLLSPASQGGGGASAGSGAYQEEDILSVAEQRQMIWVAVHEALWNADKVLPEVVVEIFMLQDVWLYDRLFRWLALRPRKQSLKERMQTLSQEELDLIVHQFGEETATHFLFVEQYTRHLRVAAVVGLLCAALAQAASLAGWASAVGSWAWTLLGAFLPAWGFHFLATWRAEASKAGFRWLGSLGSVQNSVKEMARLQAMESDAEKRARYVWVTMLTVPLMGVQLLVVLGVTVVFVVIEVCLYDVVWETIPFAVQMLATVVFNLAFGIAFMLILGLFYPISDVVTRWEGHPDRDLARWHHTAKVYANWFFAVFFYFFVIAFLYVPFGQDLAGLVVPPLEHGRSLGEAHAARSSAAHADGEAVRGMGRMRSTVRHALSEFRPEARRLTTDVLLFFVLQDAMRLSQVLLPVARALMGRLRSRHNDGRAQRQRRAAALSEFLGRLWFCLQSSGHSSGEEPLGAPRTLYGGRHSEEEDESYEDEDEDEDEDVLLTARSHEQLVRPARGRARSSSSQRSSQQQRQSLGREAKSRASALKGLPSRVPATPATWRSSLRASQALPPLAAGQGCLVAYLLVRRVSIDHAREGLGGGAREEVAMLACGLDSPKAASRAGPAVTSRLRACYASETQPGLLEEDPGEDLGDLFTLSCEGAVAEGSDGGSSAGAVRINLLIEILEPEASWPDGAVSGTSSASRAVTPNSWRSVVELRLDGGGGESKGSRLSGRLPAGMGAITAESGVAELGPARVEYVAGLLRARTHYEALEQVPRALRRALEGLPVEDPAEAPTAQDMAYEEARALCGTPDLPQATKQAGLPWVWWDEELAGLYWEEVFELFSVKETFETFEIYTHLVTSFSYVCLFGVSAPICPALALLFTSIEVRQDQLRLLWLSRPPHPDGETLRFKWRVSLGAWYEILRFTCHLSVVVNLLLWGLTYEGVSNTRPADWNSEHWWKALALFLLVERLAVQIAKLVHQYFSQLDHTTASAYLRRYQRLRRVFTREDEEEDSSLAPRSSRQLRHEVCRRRLTRIPSKGLSSLV